MIYLLKKICLPGLLLIFWLAGCGEKKSAVAPNNPPPDSLPVRTPPDTANNIVFFGNSITAGYGLEPENWFTTLLQERIDSLRLPYRVVNAGISGETSAGGLSRIDWVLSRPVTIFILELGGNDGLRGISLQQTTANLQAIIDRVSQRAPSAKLILAGMEIPPNLGARYTTEFHDLYPALAKKNRTHFIPFLLEGVGGVDSLNQHDGIHPNEKGEKIVAENIWKVLRKLLGV